MGERGLRGGISACEQADFFLDQGQRHGDAGAFADAASDIDLAAVFAHDAADNHETETGAHAAGGEEGLEEAIEVLGGDAFAGISETDAHFEVVESGFHRQGATVGHGLASVADEVVKSLLHLIAIQWHGGDVGAKGGLHGDVMLVEFRLQKAQGFQDQFSDHHRLQLRLSGADGGQKLADDEVEAFDFGERHVEVLLQFGTGRPHFAQSAFEQLQVDGEGVEGVAELVGDAGGEHGEGADALALDFFLGQLARLGDVTDQHDEAERDFVVDGGDGEVEVAIFGINDLQVAADHRAGLQQFGPVQAAHALGEFLTHDLLGFQAEESAGGAVDVGDLAFGIEQDDAFLESLKDFLEEALVLEQIEHDVLEFARFQAIHAFDKLVNERGSHKLSLAHECDLYGFLHVSESRECASNWHHPGEYSTGSLCQFVSSSGVDLSLARGRGEFERGFGHFQDHRGGVAGVSGAVDGVASV